MKNPILALCKIACCSCMIACCSQFLPAQTPKSDITLSADKLFVTDRLIEIDIQLPTKEWDEIRVQARDFATAIGKEPVERPFTWTKGDITIDGVKIKNVGIRKKGFLGSLNNERPSLKIKFAEYVDQKPIKGLSHLTLNNNNQDPGRILQYLTYKMYNDSGTPSPRCSFAKVTVNGKYLGIYSNVESIRKQFLKRTYGQGKGALFEGTVADFFSESLARFEAKNDAADRDVLKEIAQLLAEKELDLDKLSKLIDLDAFIKFWAMESLTGFWDGYCSNQNNFFIYQNPATSKFHFVPWGTDSSFAKTTPLPPYRIRPRSVHAKAILPNRLYRIPEIRKKYLQTVRLFLEQHWQEEKVLAEIDRVRDLLAEHVLDENTQFDRKIKSYKRFVTSRREDILEELDAGEPELKSREKRPIYFGSFGRAKITFSTKWYDQTPRQGNGLGSVKIELEMNGEKVELEDVGAYSEQSKWPSPGKPKPSAIVIVGKRKSDGKNLTFGTGLDRELFKPNGNKPVRIGGIFIEGNNFFGAGGMKMIGGTVVLSKASMENGDEVAGTMEIDLMQMKGGTIKPDVKKENEE